MSAGFDPILAAITPEHFDSTCECRAVIAVPTANLEAEFACPDCGQVSRFKDSEIAAIRGVLNGAAAVARIRIRQFVDEMTGGAGGSKPAN